MSETDAVRIYMAMETTLRGEDPAFRNAKEEWMNSPEAQSDPKAGVLRLSAPPAGRISALDHPDFQRPMLSILRDELQLDEGHMSIIEAALDSYLEAFDFAAEPLRDSLQRYRRAKQSERIVTSLERVRPPQKQESTSRTVQALRKIRAEDEGSAESRDDESRAKWEAMLERVVDAAGVVDERLTALRKRSEDRLAEMNRERRRVTVSDLVRHALELREERDRIREILVNVVQLVTVEDDSETQRLRVDSALSRARIEQEIKHGRLGGESINLWSTLRESDLPPHVQSEAETILNEHVETIASLLEERLEASLDREIRGLEYLRVRDRPNADAESVSAAAAPSIAASRRELAACVAVRDALLALLESSASRLEAKISRHRLRRDVPRRCASTGRSCRDATTLVRTSDRGSARTR